MYLAEVVRLLDDMWNAAVLIIPQDKRTEVAVAMTRAACVSYMTKYHANPVPQTIMYLDALQNPNFYVAERVWNVYDIKELKEKLADDIRKNVITPLAVESILVLWQKLRADEAAAKDVLTRATETLTQQIDHGEDDEEPPAGGSIV